MSRLPTATFAIQSCSSNSLDRDLTYGGQYLIFRLSTHRTVANCDLMQFDWRILSREYGFGDVWL